MLGDAIGGKGVIFAESKESEFLFRSTAARGGDGVAPSPLAALSA